MGPADTGGHSAAMTQVLPAQGLGHCPGGLGSLCEPLVLLHLHSHHTPLYHI